MGIGQALATDANGILGNIERAKLVFFDDPEGEGAVESVQIASSDNLMGLAKGALTKPNNKFTQFVGKLDDTLTNQTLFKKGEKDISLSAQSKSSWADKGGRAIWVQFNPSTVHISAVGGGNSQVTSLGDNTRPGRQTEFQGLDARIDMHMDLIFDDVNTQDAFAQDKGVGIGKGAGSVLLAAAGREYTVQPMIEGLHAAMKVNKQSKIALEWGDVSFIGALTQLHTKYTMFSPTGNPIRATASITISCYDVENVDNWRKAYTKMFAEQRAKSTKSIGQTVSNLINI